MAGLTGAVTPPSERAEDAVPVAAWATTAQWLRHLPPPDFDPLGRVLDLCGRVSQIHVPEFVEYLYSSATGRGTGWFHPGQSRYGWGWLAARHGVPPSGRIPRKDFQGRAEFFDRFDRNHDGVLTAADFDWPVGAQADTVKDNSAREPRPQRPGGADAPARMNQLQEKASAQLFAALGADAGGEIRQESWQALFPKVARGGEAFGHDDLQAALRGKAPAKAARPDDATEVDLESMVDQRLAHLRSKMMTQLFNVMDADRDGKVGRAEWQDWFARAAGGKDRCNLAGFRDGLALGALRKPSARFLAVFRGDAGSFFEGPRVGDLAPDFALKTHEGGQEIRLSGYRGAKPLVLIFGSFT
jgi:hypothetical protein